MDRRDTRKVDVDTHYGVASAVEAINDSGLQLEQEDCTRIGVIFGEGIGGLGALEDEVREYARNQENGPRFSPFLITKMISDMTSGIISIRYGLKGPNYVTTSACASSSNAIIDAYDQIRLGRADIIVAGGAEAVICELGVGGFNAMHALSVRNEDPQGASRPFSKSRDGFVIGEGAACLILEEYEHAVARGAKIYAEIAGTGLTADAYHITAPHPEGEGACRVMKMALDEAGLALEDVDYINVHGTSTYAGDIAEAKAIKTLFGEHAYKLNISSTKSMTGHLLGAAGAIEALLTVLTIKNGVVPPTINHADDDNDPEIDYGMNFTFNKAQERNVNVAISNTFGFGGHNASIAFKKVEG
jgi:3-oxoacyl-[acyl-carrier-protein] synthase II